MLPQDESMWKISNSIGESIECSSNEEVDTITAGMIMIAGAPGIEHSPGHSPKHPLTMTI